MWIRKCDSWSWQRKQRNEAECYSQNLNGNHSSFQLVIAGILKYDQNQNLKLYMISQKKFSVRSKILTGKKITYRSIATWSGPYAIHYMVTYVYYSVGLIPKISIPIRSQALNIDPGPIPSLGPSLLFDPGPIRSSIPTDAEAIIQIFMLWFYTYHSVLHGRILPFST